VQILDVNTNRDVIKEMYPDIDFDGNYWFYYDETNNLKRLSVREDDFNAAFQSNFILGGLVFDGKPLNMDDVFEGLKLQPNITDVKLKHLAQGNFIDCLNSKKLDYFLSCLLSKGVMVHFTWVNLLYWSVADIVDSAIANSEVAMKVGRWMGDKVKSDFYKFAKIEFDSIVELFYRYQYPNLKKEDVVSFIDELVNLFGDYLYDEELHFGLESLRQVLKEARANESMPFLKGEEDHILINNFSNFYVDTICLFKNSTHILDNEADIMKVFQDTRILDGEKELKNYSFVDSRSSKIIQASDIVVGIIGKLTHFINTNSYKEVVAKIEALNEIQRKNIDSLIKLIDFSLEKNLGFQVIVDCAEETEKFRLIREIRSA
jgi:hypothetical protein